MRRLLRLALIPAVLAVFAVSAVPAFADFVCPVFNSDAVGAHNPNAVQIGGGDYTIIPSGAMHLDVPDQATNGDGTGSPGGDHARPGDRDYSAIWNTN